MFKYFVLTWAVYVIALFGYGIASRRWKVVGRHFVYQLLIGLSFASLLPFYWMIITSFKDVAKSMEFPPNWFPVRSEYVAENPKGERVKIQAVRVFKDAVDVSRVPPATTERDRARIIDVVPEDKIEFLPTQSPSGRVVHKKTVPREEVFQVRRDKIEVTTTTLTFRIDNYVEAWYAPEVSTLGAVNFGQYFWVSIYTGILSTIGTLITSALAAYAFAWMRFHGKALFFYLVLMTMMVPGQVLLIPNFIILDWFGWLDTVAALVVPWLASVFTIFLMRQFFMTIPHDLWDAGQIDGISRFRFLWQIIVPLSKPVFITAGLFNFLGQWNSLLWPLIVTSSAHLRTLMVGLQTFNQEAGSDFHLLMAASSLGVMPVVILFFFLQRFFIEGIARSGLKS